MAGFGLDPQAAAFARQNYLSGNAQLARVDKQHKSNLQAIVNQLAGHGLLFSGDTGYQTGQEDQGYGNTVYDAQQQALADILGYRQSTAQNEQGLHQSVIDALQTAYQNYLNHPELGGYGGGGLPTYETPNGQPYSSGKKPAKPLAAPTAKLSTKAKTVAKALVNPYTTGQKRFG